MVSTQRIAAIQNQFFCSVFLSSALAIVLCPSSALAQSRSTESTKQSTEPAKQSGSSSIESSPIKTEIDSKSQDVIESYIEAMGGAMLIQSIESAEITGAYGSVGAMNDFSLLATSTGNFLLSYGSGKNRCYGDRLHQWTHHDGAEPAEYKSVRYTETFPLVTTVSGWSNYPGKISFVGEEDYEDSKVNVLLFQSPGRKPIKRYFDQDSGLMVAQHVYRYFQKLEYSDVEDLHLISRQVLYNAEQSVHQIIEYETSLNVEVAEGDFSIPAKIKGLLVNSLEQRIAKGLSDPAEGTLRIGKGD